MTAANGATSPAIACLKVMVQFGLSRGMLFEPSEATLVHYAMLHPTGTISDPPDARGLHVGSELASRNGDDVDIQEVPTVTT